MTRNEKIAWFNLAVAAVAVVFYIALFAFATIWIPKMPLGPRISFSFAAFAVVGICGLTDVIFRKEPGDERDALIERRATFGAHMLFWLYFVGFAMSVWGVHMYRGRETVSIHVLPLFVGSGFVLVVTIRSVIVLVLYRKAIDAGAEV